MQNISLIEGPLFDRPIVCQHVATHWRSSIYAPCPTCAGLLLMLGGFFIPSAPASAQNAELVPEPTLVRGAFTLESSLGIEAASNSNIFESATSVKSSEIWKLAPTLLLKLEPARSRVEFKYDGDYGWYSDSSDDDYIDSELDAGAYLLLGERSGLDLVASYADAHEIRGTGLTQGFDPDSAIFPQEPDRYETEQLLARYTYGVSKTRAFVALEGSAENLTYKSNRTRTGQFNRDENYVEATFGIRVRPKTSLQLRVRTQDIEYDNPRAFGTNPDSQENRYLLGVVWEATAKTTGSVLVGQVEKDFKDPDRSNFSGPIWEVAIRWSPRTYSYFDLGTERYTEEPVDLLGDVTDTKVYVFGWTHEWSNRLESNVALSLEDRTYRYVTGDRNDESTQFSFALGYSMRPWLRWMAGLDLNERDSDGAAYNYDQTVVRLGAWITF